MNLINKAQKEIARSGTGEAVTFELVGSFKKVNSIELHRVVNGQMVGAPLTERGGDIVRGKKWVELDLLTMWEAKNKGFKLPKTSATVPKNSESLAQVIANMSDAERATIKKLLG